MQASFHPGHTLFSKEGSKAKANPFIVNNRSIVSMGSAKQNPNPIKSHAELISGTGLFVNLKPKENQATKELRESIIKKPKERRPLT